MHRGDLTVRVDPRTTPIDARSDDPATQALIELFNVMLGKAQGGLEAYNATLSEIAEMIASISDTAGRVAGASEQMSTTTVETGAAIAELGHRRAPTSGARGGGRARRAGPRLRVVADEVRSSRSLVQRGRRRHRRRRRDRARGG